jgi:SAM-dependent methyltransferase
MEATLQAGASREPAAARAMPREGPRRAGPIARCPACFETLGNVDPDLSGLSCARCGFVLSRKGGIWRGLSPDRVQRFERFAREYQHVRDLEGRGSPDPAFYLELPDRDLTGRNAWQWKIRARTFHFFTGKILAPAERRNPQGMRILDLGGGNGWMSYQLALRGHHPVAVDLLDNDLDGLGAVRHYASRLPQPFPAFQAELDRLPFESGQFDAAIFGASFHYSEDYERTLREVLRCLRRPGSVFILDSPLYRRDASGRAMVEERHARFQASYGFRSDSITSCEYLTPDSLARLEKACGVKWQVARPWYGLGWALRPLKARLLGRREPAKFYIFWTTVGAYDRSL